MCRMFCPVDVIHTCTAAFNSSEKKKLVVLAVRQGPAIIRLLLVEFPSKEAAEQYYDGPEHAPYKEILHKVAKSDMVIFDSGPMPV